MIEKSSVGLALERGRWLQHLPFPRVVCLALSPEQAAAVVNHSSEDQGTELKRGGRGNRKSSKPKETFEKGTGSSVDAAERSGRLRKEERPLDLSRRDQG